MQTLQLPVPKARWAMCPAAASDALPADAAPLRRPRTSHVRTPCTLAHRAKKKTMVPKHDRMAMTASTFCAVSRDRRDRRRLVLLPPPPPPSMDASLRGRPRLGLSRLFWGTHDNAICSGIHPSPKDAAPPVGHPLWRDAPAAPPQHPHSLERHRQARRREQPRQHPLQRALERVRAPRVFVILLVHAAVRPAATVAAAVWCAAAVALER